MVCFKKKHPKKTELYKQIILGVGGILQLNST